jgi:hypothetical protein
MLPCLVQVCQPEVEFRHRRREEEFRRHHQEVE